jgi:hypothetical protein
MESGRRFLCLELPSGFALITAGLFVSTFAAFGPRAAVVPQSENTENLN